MADFHWAWPKKIDREAVESALRLDFMQGARSVVIIAPQGLGKMMITQNSTRAESLGRAAATRSTIRHAPERVIGFGRNR